MANKHPEFEIDLNATAFLKDPFSYYRIMQERYPLYYYAPMDAYMLTRYDHVMLALKDPRFSTQCYDELWGHMFSSVMPQLEGAEHASYRNVVSPHLRGSSLMEQLVPIIIRNAQSLLQQLAGRETFDFVSEFSNRFPFAVFMEMLALDNKDVLLFRRWYKSIIRNLRNYEGDAKTQAEGLKLTAMVSDYLASLIDEYRDKPATRLLPAICTTPVNGRLLNNKEVVTYIGSLLAAGVETTEKTLIGLFRNLLANREMMDAVRENRALVNSAIAETLRLNSPAQVMMRRTVCDVPLGDGIIPQNARVICVIGAANRDSERFTYPDEFDVFRQDLDVDKAFIGSADHAAFGNGRHFCVGAMLAKAEVNIAANILLDHFPDLHFVNNTIPQETGFATRTPLKMIVGTAYPVGTVLPYLGVPDL